MRKLFATAAVAALMAPAAAMAEATDSLSLQMAGTVEDVCTADFDGASTIAAPTTGTVTVTEGNDAGTVSFEMDIPNTDDPSEASIGDISAVTITITADFFCNGIYEATITSQKGALVNADAVTNSDDFSNRLGYTADVTYDANGEGDNPTTTLTANTDADAETSTGPTTGSQHNGKITLRVAASQATVRPADNRNLISGLYEDALTFSFVQDGIVPDNTVFSSVAPLEAAFVGTP